MKQKYEEKDLRSLVELGREQGYLTFDQVNDFLPQDQVLDLRDVVDSAVDVACDCRPEPDDSYPGPHGRDGQPAAARDAAVGAAPGPRAWPGRDRRADGDTARQG